LTLKLPLAALLLAATSITACAAQPLAPAAQTAPLGTQDARLLAFLDSAFDAQVAMSPEAMTSLGSKTGYGRLDDYTDAQRQASLGLAERQLAEMKAKFDYARLSPAGQLSYRLFERDVERGRTRFKWRWHEFPVSTNGSPAGDIPAFLINQHRIDTVADAEAYISRLGEVERVMKEVSDNVRVQAGMGVYPPRLNFEPVRADARKVLTGAPFDSGPDNMILADFREKIGKLDAPAEVKAELITRANAALTGPFRRGYEAMFAALDELEPRAADNDGAWSLPDGDAYYADQLQLFTTTDLGADEIHQIGLDEVDRIHGEMEAIKARVGFEGTLQQFFAHIKDDPGFKYPNNDEGRQQYLKDATAKIDQVMAAAPRYFSRLPKAPLEVRAVEEWRQDTAPVAFYNRPAPDGSRPGIYYVNLADMTQVLKPQVETIAYHEGAPGHHFQGAIAQELPGIPKFRRFGGYSAYGEGWGLYAERFGKEMGFYQDPYQEFGMLSSQLWRAVRLVVDTGLHAKRWSREQAIDYFKENSLVSERDIVKEVERYINNPGQATSYMIGQIKIMELRDKAQAALGERFDIREFHTVILGNGALPLDMLEQQVDAWIEREKA
jgi:uncharacterized protein (DUF885 family)